MFWRNPTRGVLQLRPAAAVPGAVRRDLHAATRSTLDVIVPGIAGHERHGDDVQRAGDEHHLPARAGRAQAHARHAAADRRLPRPAIVANAVDERASSRSRSSSSPARLFFDIGWPKDWVELVVFVVARRRVLRLARRRLVARDPELRRGAGLREHRLPAGDLHLRRLLRRRRTRRAFLRDIAAGAAARRTSSTGCRARWSTGAGVADHARRPRGDRACGPSFGRAASRCAASAGRRRRA